MFGHNFLELSSTYSSMGAMSNAGIDIVNLLRFQMKSGAERAKASLILKRVESGFPLWRALDSAGFSKMESAMIRAGEDNGELPEVMKQLASYYHDRYVIERATMYALLQPVVMFFIAVTLAAVVPYFLGRMTVVGFLCRSLIPTSVLIGVIFAAREIFWRTARSSKHDTRLSEWLEKFKFTRAFTAAMARERFFVAFAICVKAGASLKMISDILHVLADHPTLRPAAKSFDAIVEKKGFAEALAVSGVFTDEQIAGIRVGEMSGRLEEQLEIIVRECREQLMMYVNLFSEWAPRVINISLPIIAIINIFF